MTSDNVQESKEQSTKPDFGRDSRVFGCATGTSIEECVQHEKLCSLEHVLRIPNHRLPHSEWRKQRSGQPLTWQRSMKEIMKCLGAVSATHLSGWRPRDPH
ncbi:hypothetical protein T265_06626 [Opisthorchis viverrini]|uniref:Uncharacterized protein n=1 Tax=Opisthorchis viverrini TaxID=6198 RepID=A0A074ZRT1_OPIVI|nr:hypothetical protein T265_06626 [Opisthorchis viverrini]KER26050.1 hypothetical protein T265_06626 [Opisthorchis viverrini]